MSKRISSERLRAMFPRASQSFLALNSPDMAPLPSTAITEHNPGSALQRPDEGKKESGNRPAVRFKIIFRVRSMQPCDWDNYRCKELQDLLVHAGILPDDNYAILQGEVIPEKVHSRDEEGTLIELFQQEAL